VKTLPKMTFSPLSSEKAIRVTDKVKGAKILIEMSILRSQNFEEIDSLQTSLQKSGFTSVHDTWSEL